MISNSLFGGNALLSTLDGHLRTFRQQPDDESHGLIEGHLYTLTDLRYTSLGLALFYRAFRASRQLPGLIRRLCGVDGPN
jgi:hypothetical protein